MEIALKKMREMEEKGLDVIEVNYEEAEVLEDNTFDFLEHLVERATDLRNDYAHGTNRMTFHIAVTFEYCTEIINKIFAQQEVK